MWPIVANRKHAGKRKPVITKRIVVALLYFCGALLLSCDPMGPLFRSNCPSKITLNRTSLTLYEGRTATISVNENIADCHLEWKSDNYSVVVISRDSGRSVTILGRGAGVGEITATLNWNRSTSCKVTVLPVSACSIKLLPETLLVPAGGSRSFRAVITDSVGVELTIERITWTSSDTAVASVGSVQGTTINEGWVLGRALGEVSVTATTGNLNASARVHVLPDILSSIWESEGGDVFAVGGYGTIVHYDGNRWTVTVIEHSQRLFGVWGSSENDVFAVGELTALHFDGYWWEPVYGAGGRLSGSAIWGSAANSVFAIYGATIYHYDGASWTTMTAGSQVDLLDIWGGSDSNVFAVGTNGIISHFDGESWTAIASGTVESLMGVWGASENDVFAVGGSGTIIHFDGNTWAAMSSGTRVYLSDVWGSSARDVLAVGDSNTILHYDGNKWTTMMQPTPGSLYDIWGRSSHDVFAVGFIEGTGVGRIIHFDGNRWTIVM
jgi:hypothetical protein